MSAVLEGSVLATGSDTLILRLSNMQVMADLYKGHFGEVRV